MFPAEMTEGTESKPQARRSGSPPPFDRGAHARRIARLGGLAFAAAHDGKAATELPRATFAASFAARVRADNPGLDETEVVRRAEALRRMHYVRAGLASGEARR